MKGQYELFLASAGAWMLLINVCINLLKKLTCGIAVVEPRAKTDIDERVKPRAKAYEVESCKADLRLRNIKLGDPKHLATDFP